MSDALEQVGAHGPDADEVLVENMAATCRPALGARVGWLVWFSDRAELDTVREDSLLTKLALSQPDEDLDDAVREVGEQTGDGRPNPRLAGYYLRADRFGRLDGYR